MARRKRKCHRHRALETAANILTGGLGLLFTKGKGFKICVTHSDVQKLKAAGIGLAIAGGVVTGVTLLPSALPAVSGALSALGKGALAVGGVLGKGILGAGKGAGALAGSILQGAINSLSAGQSYQLSPSRLAVLEQAGALQYMFRQAGVNPQQTIVKDSFFEANKGIILVGGSILFIGTLGIVAIAGGAKQTAQQKVELHIYTGKGPETKAEKKAIAITGG